MRFVKFSLPFTSNIHFINDVHFSCRLVLQVLTPEVISREAACQVHTVEYVDKFFGGHTTAQEQRATGIRWSPGLVSRVRYETGPARSNIKRYIVNYLPFLSNISVQ